MDMKKRLFALAAVPVLSLLTAVALADVSGPPNVTGIVGITADFPDQIKNRNECDGATFFKNVFPSLTNGTPGGSETLDFTVDGKTVSMTVTWDIDNSFFFEVFDGYTKKVGVTVDQNYFVYDFTGRVADGIVDSRFTDTELNYYGGEIADDINHLDLCLETLDTAVPEVSIRVEPSSDGTTVSGDVDVIATVTDESGLDSVTIQIISADGTLTILVCDPADPECELTGPIVSGNEYTWKLKSGLLPVGEYLITVTATDQSILANQTIETKQIEVVRSLLNCLDNTDGVPGVPTGASDGGCKITEAVQLEYPGELEPYVGTLQVLQDYIPARPGTSSPLCNPDGDFPNIAQDPRISTADGKTYVGPARTLNLGDLFDIAGHYAVFHPGVTPDDAVLSAEVVGSPCLALVHQDAPDFFDIANLLPVGFTYNEGPVYTVTQFPEDVPGMYANTSRYAAPLDYCDPNLACYQPDPQNVEQAAYQPDDRFDLVLPFAQALTNFIYNPPRTSGFKGSFWPINTREVCPDIPIVDPATPAYIAEVYQCKIDLALRYEADTEQVLVEADAVGSLDSPSLNNLLNWLNRAQSQIRNSHFERCVSNLEKLESDIINGVWNDVLDPTDGESRNDQGRALTYTRNLRWRCEQLLLTEAYLDSLP